MIDKIIEILKEILKPSSIYALMIYGTFCYLAITGKIEARFVCEVVLIVMAFYYGTKAGQNGGQK